MTVGGVIVVSFRGTNNADNRENGKLYTAISVDELITFFLKYGAKMLHYGKKHEVGRGLEWHNLVFRKSSHPVVSIR